MNELDKSIIQISHSDIVIGDYLINLGEVLENNDLQKTSTLVIKRFGQKHVFKLDIDEPIYVIR
ncbi:hypothetical protein [Pedobacter antarcticus]|uniref:hypothetical protein n=1 Tax=Pedobacter antarcticus TaxID=34086 RepID=UPI000884F7DD|nr:hypothetical protein [Pedobacter antarcticus]SDM82472.1 hypothetical protein SAMN04488084_1153 [Pedobacter antarcticus]